MRKLWNRLTGEEERNLREQREKSEEDNRKHLEQTEAQLEKMKQAEQKQREKSETENKRHQEQMQKAEQKHQEELEKKDQQIAIEKKLSRKRTKLSTKKPGVSYNFPEGVKAPSRLFISLFGETGSGKTSLINSLQYTIEGQLTSKHRLQSSPNNFQGAHTLESLEVVMTKHMSVIDNPGINSEKASNATEQEKLIRAMEGKYDRGTMTWLSLAPTHENEEDKKSYCSILVFAAHNVKVVRKYREFIKCLRDWQGRYPIAVITHVDVDKPTEVRQALESAGIEDIYEVANITSGTGGRNEVSREHQLKIHKLFENCFKDGDLIFLRRKGI